MLTIMGSNYYIDVDELENRVNIGGPTLVAENTDKPETQTEEEVDLSDIDPEKQISIVRYDLFKNMIEVLITEREELDESLGLHGGKNLSIPFKLAYNTLLINNILKKI